MKNRKVASLTMLALLVQGTAFANLTHSDIAFEFDVQRGNNFQKQSQVFAEPEAYFDNGLSNSIIAADINFDLIKETNANPTLVRVDSREELILANKDVANSLKVEEELQKPSFTHKALSFLETVTSKAKSFFSSIARSIYSCFGGR